MSTGNSPQLRVALATGAATAALLLAGYLLQRRKRQEEEASPGNSRLGNVDLHGRPWMKRSPTERAKWFESQPEGVARAEAAARAAREAEIPVEPPLGKDGVELPITPETLPRWLTVVMTTSPVTSNPDTALIEEIVRSFEFVPYLASCPKLIICDGCKVREKNKFRSGEVTAERRAAYEGYKRNLRELGKQGTGSVFEGAKLLELEERQGFGFAMKAGVAHVATPFMIVVQHDRSFLGGFDLVKLVKAMHRHRRWLYFVGLPTSRTIKHKKHVLSRYKLDVKPVRCDVPDEYFDDSVPEGELGLGLPPEARTMDAAHQSSLERLALEGPAWAPEKADPSAGDLSALQDGVEAELLPSGWQDGGLSRSWIKLIPLVQWYDSTHVASTGYYRRFVFDPRYKRVAKGGFIEDKLGQQQLKLILERGMGSHASYGTFILDVSPENAPVLEGMAHSLAAVASSVPSAMPSAVPSAVPSASGRPAAGELPGSPPGSPADSPADSSAPSGLPAGVGLPLVGHLDGHDPRNAEKFVFAEADPVWHQGPGS